MRALGRLWPAMALCALAACGSSDDDPELGAPPRYPVPGCEHLDHAACDVRTAPCQTGLLELAACLRGDVPGELPPVSMMTETEYAAYLGEQIAMLEPAPQPNHFERALVLLGLATQGALAPSSIVAERVENVGGFYRRDDKNIVIIDHGPDSTALDFNSTLVHEFIHALQDRSVDLAVWSEPYSGTYDEQLAIGAVIEGEARLHQSRYRASLLGLDPAEVDWTRQFQNSVERAEDWVFEQASRYTTVSSSFPYAWGARFMYFGWAAGGFDGVQARFATPPRSTRRLMASVDAAVEEDVEPSEITPPVAPEGWTEVEQVVMGAWVTFLFLGASRLERDAAREAALGWRGDRLWVYTSATSPLADGSPVTALVWYLDFADVPSAATAARLAGIVLGSSNVQQEDNRLRLRATDGALPTNWAFVP